MPAPRRRGKDIPRLPLSAFGPSPAGASDAFPIPPTPSLVAPSAVVDAHLEVSLDAAGTRTADIPHLTLAQKRAVVLSPRAPTPEAIVRSVQSLQTDVVDARVLCVLVPLALDSTQLPESPSPLPAAFATTYDAATPVAAEAEEEARDEAQVETPVRNLRWALQHGRVVDLDIERSIVAADASSYDGLVNLLTKAIKSDTDAARAPIVLTNVLPPPLDSITPVVTMMNHPTYTTYRHRISLLSLSENVCVKLLPPAWVSADLEEKQEKESRNLLKLFIVPVLEAFGFERIIFGSSPVSAGGSPALAERWYKLVLESFRELAVSQDEMDKIFAGNAERVYGAN